MPKVRADAGGVFVDTRADVYGLGARLSEGMRQPDQVAEWRKKRAECPREVLPPPRKSDL